MEEFIETSRQLGENILYVQGAGGNSSVKIKDKLYIKASGYKLKNMTNAHGYACCLYKPMLDFLINKKTHSAYDEALFLALVNDSLVKAETYGLPSMETGFHAVIPSKYVFHLHSLYTNIFACMKYGTHILRRLCANIPYMIIDYKNPGYELAHFLSKRKSLPPLIFLRNHGLIVHGENTADCLKIIELLHATIEEYLKINKALVPLKISSQYAKMQNFSFPDSAVFLNIDPKQLPPRKKEELLEINSAQRYIVETIKRLGKQPVYLNKTAVNKLLNMDQEKHRIEIFKT